MSGHGANRKYFKPKENTSFFGALINDVQNEAGALADTVGYFADEAGNYFKKTYSPENLRKAYEGAGIAFDRAKAAPGETLRDIGRGTMAGLAQTGADISGGFGFFDNKFSRNAQNSANWWRNGIEDKNSVGSAIADEATQLAAFGPALKTLKYGSKGAKLLTKGMNNYEKAAMASLPAYAIADEVTREPAQQQKAPISFSQSAPGSKVRTVVKESETVKTPEMKAPVTVEAKAVKTPETSSPIVKEKISIGRKPTARRKNSGLTKTDAFDYLDLF